MFILMNRGSLLIVEVSSETLFLELTTLFLEPQLTIKKLRNAIIMYELSFI